MKNTRQQRITTFGVVLKASMHLGIAAILEVSRNTVCPEVGQDGSQRDQLSPGHLPAIPKESDGTKVPLDLMKNAIVSRDNRRNYSESPRRRITECNSNGNWVNRCARVASAPQSTLP